MQIKRKISSYFIISQKIKAIYSKFVGKSIDPVVLNQIEVDKYSPAEIIFHLVHHIQSEQKCEEIMAQFI